ncbi:phosphatidylserine decarboxylase [Sulfurospirillum arcachonense]|uniref:phosphatidylserine decarboxylase n=1 Tax=Sulfurospirillum arcachonense TaxID=57666 RepID=UPI00046928F7|nr:phosphatidylserine decarboxylase [Sulfurospirillum arcachonense]
MTNFKSSCASRIFGCFASHKFPNIIQNIINKSYVKLMKVNLSECPDISSYKSLNELFTRELKTKRDIDADEHEFISPCDAFISECGNIQEQKALMIKGHSYRVRNLLGDYILKQEKDRLIDGDYINFYLSPKDYHRYHVPMDMQIKKAVHIPGKLYPVNFTWLKKIPELFVENERVVLECYTKDDKLFYMVFVGALNVGKMQFVFDETIQTNAKSSTQKPYMYKDLWLKKGDELGRFEMGSTIVMFFEKDMVELTCRKDEPIKFSEKICKVI